MSSLGWYWARLQAMSPAEMGKRLERKAKSLVDRRKKFDGNSPVGPAQNFPKLPDKSKAPAELLVAIQRDAAAILSGAWIAFRDLPLRVADPPEWHCDYLAEKNLKTDHSAFVINHRSLPDGVDIKVIWELSRWNQLVRLAQAAWLLEDEIALIKCLEWLHHWSGYNPPLIGWNWTSPLETAIRLIQFAWISALLAPACARLGRNDELGRLHSLILPPHTWFTWRYRSFGSSANNHLLGELSGLIIALARWPALRTWAGDLIHLKQLWEREVLAQFAADGGNREQALNYHLFSFEFAWQARAALHASSSPPSADVESRLRSAAKFFVDVQVEDAWDYGDSDSAFVTPFFIDQGRASQEWREWMHDGETGRSFRFWLGEIDYDRSDMTTRYEAIAGWHLYPETGIAVQRAGDWTLRWDLSPLGYLATGAHGHLDALHLSIWFQGKAFIIDPGTAAYYGNPVLRTQLAAGDSHNGPRLPQRPLARRLGPFLWDQAHAKPAWLSTPDQGMTANIKMGRTHLFRKVEAHAQGWTIEDGCENADGPLMVRWQFAPETRIRRENAQLFRVERLGSVMWMEVLAGEVVGQIEDRPCSRSFRRVESGPSINLQNAGHKPCVLKTAFLASRPL